MTVVDFQMIPESPTLLNIIQSYHEHFRQLSDEDKGVAYRLLGQIKLDKKIPIKYKPIKYIHPSTPECTICGSCYNSEDRIVECSSCHQHLHSKCSLEWAYNSISDQSYATCPFCRSPWKDTGKLHYPLPSPLQTPCAPPNIPASSLSL
jgi:hypothetical protein